MADTNNKKAPCCPMRIKVVIAIMGELSEERCGVPDSVITDYIRWDLSAGDRKAVVQFRFCPWCGTKYADDASLRITNLTEVNQGPDHFCTTGNDGKCTTCGKVF